MSRLNKLLTVFLSALVIFTAVALLGFDAVAANTQMTLETDELYAITGESIEVKVSVSNVDQNLGALSLKVEYDESVLTLTGVKDGDALVGFNFIPSDNLNSGSEISWLDISLNSTPQNGTLMTLEFDIAQNTENGTYPIKITHSDNRFLDKEEKPITNVSVNDGSITVLSYKPGDATGNGTADIGDALRICRYIASGRTLEIVELAADPNADGRVDIADALRLCRYVAGHNVKLLPGLQECDHDMTEVEAKASTCTEEGNIAYWNCQKCDKYFSDENGAVEITLADTVVPVDTHTSLVGMTSIEAKEATCTEEGNIAYWYCEKCGKYFTEMGSVTEITLAETVIPVAAHISVAGMIAIEAKEPTCTETGNIAYWYCEKCGKYFTDENGATEIALKDTVISATGHIYADIWSSNETYHWHAAICGHTGEVSDKAEHVYVNGNICYYCGYHHLIKLDAPEIIGIEYDTITWSPVPNAVEYLVTINYDYTFKTTQQQTKIGEAARSGDGKKIDDHGKIRVTVQALGHGEFSDSEISDAHTSYYYVPPTESVTVAAGTDTAEALSSSFGFGKGYDLINDKYLDTSHPKATVLDVTKLLTVGTYNHNNSHPTAGGSGYNYSSIDEYISNESYEADGNLDLGLSSIGSVKAQLNATSNLAYKNYAYTETYIYDYYKNQGYREISGLGNNVLKYCLAEEFIKDITLENDDAFDKYWESQEPGHEDAFMEFLFGKYGTHAILGVEYGGKYQSRYVISTNKEDVASEIRNAFNLNMAIDSLVKLDFGVNLDSNGKESSSGEETEARFNVSIIGGNAGLTTTAGGVEAALAAWQASFNGSNDASIAFTENGAVSISSLIAYVNPQLAEEYEAYINKIADETYHELFSQYNKPASLDMDIETESGNNVLVIDLSIYQRAGTLGDTYSPYLLDNVLTIHPTMFGKSINKIYIKGGLDNPTYRELIDSLSIRLSSKWNRDVEIVVEDLGVISTSSAGFIDTSKIIKNIQIDITYDGLNVIKDTSGLCKVYVEFSTYKRCFSFSLIDGEELDFTTFRFGDGTVYLPIAVKASYDFGGWNDASGTQIANSIGKMVTLPKSDVTALYANWLPQSFKITMDTQGAQTEGTTEIYEQYGVGYFTQREGGSRLYKITVPARTGYVFGGYYESVENNATVSASFKNQIIDKNGNITADSYFFNQNSVIEALWIPKVIKITLDNQGADETGTTEIYQQFNTGVFADDNAENALADITVPKKAGYVFAGYYLSVSNNGGEFASGSTMIIDAEGRVTLDSFTYSSDTSVYALWTAGICTITLDNQNATVAGSAKYYVKYNVGAFSDQQGITSLSTISIPSRTGYIFDGYYEGVSNNGTVNAAGEKKLINADGTFVERAYTAYSKNTTLYALWISNVYTVTLDNQSATTAGTRVYYQMYGDNIYSDQQGTAGLSKITVPKRTGYTFGGYYEIVSNSGTITGYYGEEDSNRIQRIAPDGTILATSTTYTENKTLYAKWTANTYTIVFDSNGGSGSTASMTCTYDQPFYMPTGGFTRSGYGFCGWSPNKEDKNAMHKVNQLIEYNLKTEGTVTLYAVWVKTQYTATWDIEEELGRDDSYTQTIYPNFDKNALLNSGYTTFTLTLSVKHEETNMICHNESRIRIQNAAGTINYLDERWDPKSGENTKQISVKILIKSLGDDASFKIVYSTVACGGSSSDGWYMRDPKLSFIAS